MDTERVEPEQADGSRRRSGYGVVQRGGCRTCTVNASGGGHRAECNGMMRAGWDGDRNRIKVRARPDPAPGSQKLPAEAA